MTTEQRYVGKGNNAPNSSQTVNSDQQPAQNRLAQYTEQLDSAYQDLAGTVESLLYQGERTTPVEVINDLLLFWLETNHCDHNNPLHAERLSTALNTVSYLHKLTHQLESVELFRREISAAKTDNMPGQIWQFGKVVDNG